MFPVGLVSLSSLPSSPPCVCVFAGVHVCMRTRLCLCAPVCIHLSTYMEIRGQPWVLSPSLDIVGVGDSLCSLLHTAD